jgi:hypothetical protein
MSDAQMRDYVEDLAATMLASTLGIEFNPDAAWDERKRVYELSDLIVDSLSITASAEGAANGDWTCAVAAAVCVMTASPAYAVAPTFLSVARRGRDAASPGFHSISAPPTGAAVRRPSTPRALGADVGAGDERGHVSGGLPRDDAMLVFGAISVPRFAFKMCIGQPH